MMARSTALQAEAGYIDARPHLLDVEIFLHRTAGPYTWVTSSNALTDQKISALPSEADITFIAPD
ncbi:hypothetical protein AXW67_05245 [Bradyrhizobium neotropicale]|uniref:Uncharacterized protein n=1 Tax=Bradyrhizobium neotropicale TaxID=1497615 RepID=A0A176ZDC6_9BRAD|nr:hypothetical protein AXW67_05245 [Bradyrhizobium neotropicale]